MVLSGQLALLLTVLSALAAVSAQTLASQVDEAGTVLAKMQLLNGFGGGDTLKPWHLKATYEIYDRAEKIAAAGTFEEWWAGRDLWRRTYTGSHYTGSEYRLNGGFVYEGWPALLYVGDKGSGEPNLEGDALPWPEALIANKLLYPFTRSIHGKDFGNLLSARFIRPADEVNAPDCISLNRESQLLAEGYCPVDSSLELNTSVYHFVSTRYGRKINFQNRLIPAEAVISVNHHSLLKLHVVALEEMQADNGYVFAMNSPKTWRPAACVGGYAMLSAKNPILEHYPDLYPLDARRRDVEGAVFMEGTIGKDGYLTDLQVVESPDPLLSATSLKSHIQHSGPFEPSTRDGEPVACRWSGIDVYMLSR